MENNSRCDCGTFLQDDGYCQYCREYCKTSKEYWNSLTQEQKFEEAKNTFWWDELKYIMFWKGFNAAHDLIMSNLGCIPLNLSQQINSQIQYFIHTKTNEEIKNGKS